MVENVPGVDKLIQFTTEIVAAYVSNNEIAISDVPQLVSSVYQSLLSQGAGGSTDVKAGRPDPAVSPKKSVFPDYIICLEDGKKLKMLKRHLKASYNLTPEQYRERWNLSADYPMVAPNYARQRSRLAKQIGLGTARRIVKKAA